MKIQGFPGSGLHFGGNEDRIQLTRPNAGKHMMDTIGEAIVSIVLAIVSIVPSYSIHDTGWYMPFNMVGERSES